MRGRFSMSQKYRVVRKKVIFSKGPIRLVDCDVRRPDGKVLSRQIFEHPGCVVVVPRTAAGRYVLVRQYRYPLGKYLWEFPAGGREPGESFPQAARRELAEEVSLHPRRLKKLAAFYPTPGVSGEEMHLYLATNLAPAFAEKDEDEDFEVREFDLREIGRLIAERRIVDGKTIIGFFYLKNLKSQ